MWFKYRNTFTIPAIIKLSPLNTVLFQNYLSTMLEVLEIILLFIASLNGHVFESAEILGNSFCYCRSEKPRNK
jgi:hypothetical protein